MPPTTALEYTYSSKTRDEKKVTINAYELGGGRELSSMLQSCVN